jgi:hypothetical protein
MYRNALYDTQMPLDAKHNFGVTCPDVLFVEMVPGPSEHEK